MEILFYIYSFTLLIVAFLMATFGWFWVFKD